MGAYFGSVHVRTDDVSGVLASLQKIAKKKGCRFLLAPAIDGWTSFFPEGNGQDFAISKTVARAVVSDVLHVTVHHDDVFSYQLYREGKLIDEYCSNPDYFGVVAKSKKRKSDGRLDVLASLLPEKGQAERLAELRKILSEADDQLFAGEALETFARVLRLPNAVTAYEYLETGETEGVRRWKEFVHIPDRSEEQAREKEQAAVLNRASEALRQQGLLLMDEASSPKSSRLDSPIPRMCRDPRGNGFLACWPELMSTSAIMLYRYEPPWLEKAPTGISLEATTHELVPSPCGRYLAVLHAGGNWKVDVWDLAEARLLCTTPHSDHATSWALFAPEGNRLLTECDGRVFSTTLPAGETEILCESGSVRSEAASIDPSGRYLVLAAQDKMGLVDLVERRVLKYLFVGGKQDLSGIHAVLAAQMQAALTPAMKAKMDRKLGKAREQLEKMFKRSGIKAPRAPELPSSTEEFVAREMAALTAPEHSQRGVERLVKSLFACDGRLLVCATSSGLRVFQWAELLAADETTPPPLYSLPTGSVSGGVPSESSYVYGICHDAQRNLALYCGLSGTVNALDLSTGRSGVLAAHPEKIAALSVELSADRSAVCCAHVSAGAKEKQVCRVSIWNYPALLEQWAG